MNEQIIAKLRERIAQHKAQKAQPTWAELCERIKRNIEARAAEQAAQEAKEGGE